MVIGGLKREKLLSRNSKNLEYPEYASAKEIKAKIDLSLSENEYHSERALERMKKFTEVNLYKLSQDQELLELISEKLRVKKESILITAGCDCALHHIAETFLEMEDKVVIPIPCFGRYEFHTKVCGGSLFLSTFPSHPMK